MNENQPLTRKKTGSYTTYQQRNKRTMKAVVQRGDDGRFVLLPTQLPLSTDKPIEREAKD